MISRKEIVFEHTVNDRVYRFSMPDNAPLGEIYDAMFTSLKIVAEYAAQAVVSSQAQAMPQAPIDTCPQPEVITSQVVGE
jgi:hypothetical protein